MAESWPLRTGAAVEPAAQPRRRTKPASKPGPAGSAAAKRRVRQRARARHGVLWIAVSGILLAGVVFVNLAVLRLNLQLDRATQERAKLRAENAALQSELSSALASPRIQQQARQVEGLVPADPSTIGYIDLGRK